MTKHCKDALPQVLCGKCHRIQNDRRRCGQENCTSCGSSLPSLLMPGDSAEQPVIVASQATAGIRVCGTRIVSY